MIRELTSEDVIDISLFLRENSVKGNPEFLLSCFNSPNEFTLRNLRNAFFKFRVQIFGEVSETEIKDIVVFQHSEIKHSSFMTLAICRMVGGELLSQTIPSVFRLNKETCLSI